MDSWCLRLKQKRLDLCSGIVEAFLQLKCYPLF